MPSRKERLITDAGAGMIFASTASFSAQDKSSSYFLEQQYLDSFEYYYQYFEQMMEQYSKHYPDDYSYFQSIFPIPFLIPYYLQWVLQIFGIIAIRKWRNTVIALKLVQY
jgi:hypothetical protein